MARYGNTAYLKKKKVCHPYYSITLIKKYINCNLSLINVDCFTFFFYMATLAKCDDCMDRIQSIASF